MGRARGSHKKNNVRSRTSQPKKHAKRDANKGDPVEIILAKLAEMDQLSTTEVQEDILLRATGYARSDSTGYRKATKTLTKELGYATRTNKVWTLTELGRNYLLENGTIVIPEEPKTNQEYQEQLKELMLKTAGTAPSGKIDIVFALLQDGTWHTVEDLLAATGYRRTDSTGYRSIMTAMKKLELLEKSKKEGVRFSDKAFPFGRP